MYMLLLVHFPLESIRCLCCFLFLVSFLMGLRECCQRKEMTLIPTILKQTFYILTLILLSLLLPLSFLLLARLSAGRYLIAFIPYPPPPASFLLSFFLYTNPALLHAVVSFFSVTTLLHGLTGRVSPSNRLSHLSSTRILQPSLGAAWILLCTLQIYVGLGMVGVVTSGAVRPVEHNDENGTLTLLCRVIFFLGLHETMLHWSRVVVKPVVDDTLFGIPREGRWVEKVAIGASFGALWWWRLRDEVEVLVHVVQAKKQLPEGLVVADVVSWWLYYLTVIVGMVRLGNWIVWIVKVFLCRSPSCISNGDDDEKV